MKKFFLILTAIYLLLLAFLGIITCIVSFIGLHAKPDSLPSGFSPLYLLIFYLPFIGWLIATGIGLLLKKIWARYSILAMSGFAIFMGIIFCLVFNFMPLPETANESVTVIIKAVFTGLSAIFLIGLPIVYLVFFTRPSIKELFTSKEYESKPKLARPVGISFLAILYLIGAVFSIVYAIFPIYPALPLFGGVLVSGWFLLIYQLVIGLLGRYVAYGFWKMQKTAWFCFIALCSYGIIAGLINTFTLNAEVFEKFMPQNYSYSINPVLIKIGSITGVILAIVFIIYVISKKALFLKATPSSEEQPQPIE